MANRIVFISFEEFNKLIKACKDDKEMRLIILLCYGSGLRISEVLGLEKAISSCCREPIIRGKKIIDGKKRKAMMCSKCSSILTVGQIRRRIGEWDIPQLTSDKIDLRMHQIKIDLAKGGKWRITNTTKGLTPELIKLLPITTPRRTVQYRFGQLTKRILGKKLSPHALRHGFGNHLANDLKRPLPVIQQVMGHSNIATTGIYTMANPQEAISQIWDAMAGEN